MAWLIVTTFVTGFRLFRKANDPFFKALGLGLAAWVLCCITANCFGDRWSYLQVNGYMWILGGLVCAALRLENNDLAVSRETIADEVAGSPLLAEETKADRAQDYCLGTGVSQVTLRQ